MILKIIATGSKANSYALIGKEEILLIEAGVPLFEVKKNINFEISKVVGCLVSHAHMDHCRYADAYCDAGINVFKRTDAITSTEVAHMGDFNIIAFPLVHDVPCAGFLVKHKEIGKLLFVTDTQYVKYRFEDLGHVMIEANYDRNLVGSHPHRDHVLRGHMEIGTTCEFLQANRSDHLKNVVLLHMSDFCSNESDFVRRAAEASGARTYAARNGIEIDLEVV